MSESKPKRVWDGEALTRLLSQVRAGVRKVEIAKQLGVSVSFVAQMVLRAERLERIDKLKDFTPYRAGRGRYGGAPPK